MSVSPSFSLFSFFSLQTNSPKRKRKTRRWKRVSLSLAPFPYLQSLPLLSLSAQMNETEDYAQLSGSPGQQRLNSSSSPARVICALFPSLRNHFGPSLGCQTGERTSRWRRRGLHAKGRTSRWRGRGLHASNIVNNADNHLSTNPTTTLPARLPSVPASLRALSRPSHLAWSFARALPLSLCVRDVCVLNLFCV